MMKPNRLTTASVMAAAAFMMASPAVIQAYDSGQSEANPVQLAQATQDSVVSEGKLNQFVDAFVAVQSIRDQIAGELQRVETEGEAQELRQQAQDQMVSAVEAQGISVQEYNEVAMQMQEDSELLETIQEMAAQRM